VINIPDKDKMQNISINIPENYDYNIFKIIKLDREEYKSRSNVLRRAIEDFLKKQEQDINLLQFEKGIIIITEEAHIDEDKEIETPNNPLEKTLGEISKKEENEEEILTGPNPYYKINIDEMDPVIRKLFLKIHGD
jgi:Arc/MetJ-type ribon-helix-helix transcriptional regulator